jgi:predicted aldo/keto reductase-like oxidoreductase
MIDISRRDFFGRASAAVGAVALAPALARVARAGNIASATDTVTLGKTGIQTSVLGIGTGFMGGGRSSNHVKMGQVAFTKLLRHAVERGIRYIDSADMYGSHIFVREALKGVDRGKLFIQTKSLATHPEVLKADIERFRQELGMDCLDSLLMHCMQKGSWPTDMRPVMDALNDAKAKKQVRAVGISLHGIEPLEAAAQSAWPDLQLTRINPFGACMDAKPEKVVSLLRKIHGTGRGVIGMKICGGGSNTGAADRAKSLRYVLGLGCVDCFVIGFERPEQIDQVFAQIEATAKV